MKLFLSLKLVCLVAMGLLTMEAHAAISGITVVPLMGFNDTNNGANPYTPPVLGKDGNLYGGTAYGGSNDIGVIYQITTNSQITVLHEFSTNNLDGAYPVGQLVVAQNGELYGTAGGGGTNSDGTIFKITTNGVFTLLYTFGAVTNDSGYSTDGAYPYGGLVQGRDGNFYGVTYEGGISNVGTVFQFSTNGVLTTLHSFTGGDGSDEGSYPYTASLIEVADGVFYGTTSEGGTNGDGTIFRITASGELTTLCEFNETNGLNPYAGLSLGTDGYLYGSTVYGGTNDYGAVFRVSTNGVLTTLFSFSSAYGLYPESGVVVGLNNVLYGTTYSGGTNGYGVVFQLTTNKSMTTLYSFTYGSDGGYPYAGLTLDAAGNLYGTTLYGGTNGGYGTVFRLRDTANPTNAITAPTANQRWTNSLFTVAGKAGDNAGVADVFVSANGVNWTTATTTNRWTNWTAQVALLPGTNAIRAYTRDFTGNLSSTNSVNMDCVVTNQLVIRTVGLGVVKPNYSNAWLEVGRNYSITSAPASGFVFTNWTLSTNWVGGVIYTGTNLQFTMQSNLTLLATYTDTNSPTLSITNATTGKRWSNAVFSVKGTVTDNWQSSNVWYSLNGAAWSTASTTNSWTNWSAEVSMLPGTNWFQAYAVDTSGNLSVTNGVYLDYVVTNQLIVSRVGLGTIKPNYSNAWLEVGRNYSITSVPNSGFVFTNWTLSTNWVGGVAYTSTNLQFTMQSNLTLLADFSDVTKPTVTISYPTASQKMTNALVAAIGTASDNWQLGNVWYQLNSGTWYSASSTNSYTNWYTTSLPLNAGTNSLKVYAVDLAGNLSTTNSVSVVSSNAFQLVLSFPMASPLTSTGLNLSLALSTGLNGRIQVSSNLQDWNLLTNFVGTNTTLNFRDSAATNASLRFYRAVVP